MLSLDSQRSEVDKRPLPRLASRPKSKRSPGMEEGRRTSEEGGEPLDPGEDSSEVSRDSGYEENTGWNAGIGIREYKYC